MVRFVIIILLMALFSYVMNFYVFPWLLSSGILYAIFLIITGG